MKAGQILVTREGIEVCSFFMEVNTVTQGYMVGTHVDSYNVDFGGKDGGIDPIFAPCTVKPVFRDLVGSHAVVFESVSPVLFRDGTVDYFTMRLVHDNFVLDIDMTKVYKQGEKIYDEGTFGFATGNHVHVGVAKGKYKGVKLSSAKLYKLIGDVPPETLMFVNDTVMRKPVYEWEVYEPMNLIEPKLPKATVLASVLQYRDAPTTSGKLLGKLPKGGVFNFYGETFADGYRWAKIDLQNEVVWCAMASKEGTPWLSVEEPEYEKPINGTAVIDGVTVTLQRGTIK